MDLDKIPLLQTTKKRLAWLSQRQQVLAKNIANADTPDFRPHDLKPFTAGDPQAAAALDLKVTRPGHLAGVDRGDAGFADRAQRKPFETSPAGNAVVLEEQMAKVSETQLDHKLATELYRKHLGMFRMAVGSRP
jgi:flagellar basal-body rod protein FlgB